ncbi:MAG: class I SAM-dependent methyltransferase [Planctomycetota bacterium]|jgi:SAM-dependent methyltransferase
MNRDHYDAYWRGDSPPPVSDPTSAERKRRLARVLSRLPAGGGRVLDLGCGNGDFAKFMRSLGLTSIGVDVSRVAVESAKDRDPEGHYLELSDDGSIPLEDASVDAVWSGEVLEHVFDVRAHLAQVGRVLRPGGLYVLSTPFHGRVKDVLISLFRFSRHFDPFSGHIRFFDRTSLRSCLEGAGLNPISWSGVGRFWPVYRSWFVVAAKAAPS